MGNISELVRSRVAGGNVLLDTGRNPWIVRYRPTAARSTLSAVLETHSYSDGQRVIADANGRIREIGGYRCFSLTPDKGSENFYFRQLVDKDGEDIEGAVFPLDKHSLPMSGLGESIRFMNRTGGISTVAVSDPHGEGFRIAQLLFELPEAKNVLVNGDIVDRGPGWWRIYMALTGIPNLLYNWGNHDAMWFGAGVGNKALVAELFRWLFRYDEQATFAETFGIDFSRLEEYAKDKFMDANGNYKAKVKRDGVDIGKAIEAALTEIKLKLEAQDRYPSPAEPLSESENRILMALRHNEAVSALDGTERVIYERLIAKRRFGLDKNQRLRLQELSAKDGLSSDESAEMDGLVAMRDEGERYLAIVNHLKAADRNLTAEEQAIVDDLTEQLLRSEKFREMTLWFIETGSMYCMVDGNLAMHSHYPVDKNGKLRTIDGKVGKEAFDAITDRVKRVGAALRVFHETGNRSELNEVGADVRWMRFLAWDYESPLYGRVMQTWERAYLREESGTYDEPEDPFYSFLEPKIPMPKDAKIARDGKKLKKWQEGEGRAEMARYSETLDRGRIVLDNILVAFGLNPKTATFIKGHKPEKGEQIGRSIVHFDGLYANIDAVMSGPAADIEQGYGVLLVTTDRGELIEISIAPQRKDLIKET